jgi:hypothetical protein
LDTPSETESVVAALKLDLPCRIRFLGAVKKLKAGSELPETYQVVTRATDLENAPIEPPEFDKLLSSDGLLKTYSKNIADRCVF